MKTRQRPMCVEPLESRLLLTAGDLDPTLISVLDVPGGFPHEQGRSVAKWVFKHYLRPVGGDDGDDDGDGDDED